MNPATPPRVQSPLKSRTLIGAIVLGIGAALRAAGFELGDDDAQLTHFVNLAFDIGGLALVLWGRFNPRIAPIGFAPPKVDLGPLPLLLLACLLSGCVTLGSLEVGASDDSKTVKLTFAGK